MFTGSRFNRTNGSSSILFGFVVLGIVMITIVAVVHFNNPDLIDSVKRLFESLQTSNSNQPTG